MAYTIKVTERLIGLSLLKTVSSNTTDFTIKDILLHSKAASVGISVGDTIASLNGQSFAALVAQRGFKDPTSILWTVKLPFSLTLIRHHIDVPADEFSVDSKEEICGHEPDSESAKDSEHRIIAVRSGYKFPFRRRKVTPPDLTKDHLTVPRELLTARDSGSISTFIMESSLHPLCESVSCSNSEHSSSSNTDSVTFRRQQLLDRHILQKHSMNQSVHFDRASITGSNGKMIAVSSQPLGPGTHEWTLEIMGCDVEIQEIGVCTVCDIDGVSKI